MSAPGIRFGLLLLAIAIRAEPDLDRVLLVAQTGYGQDEDRSHAIESGFPMHLVKPVSTDALARLLDVEVLPRRP
ncbi:MAG TPA: hypothetical protein VKH41_03605 [Myxococcota bacterium]|nr:hypothetical protein [Myxococcota bacterium]